METVPQPDLPLKPGAMKDGAVMVSSSRWATLIAQSCTCTAATPQVPTASHWSNRVCIVSDSDVYLPNPVEDKYEKVRENKTGTWPRLNAMCHS